MSKAKSYLFKEVKWTAKDLAEVLGLSTHRVYRLLKDHNEDIKAIFASREETSINNPPQPNELQVRLYGKRWEKLPNYTMQEQSLNLLFTKWAKKNEKLEHILLKVSALNDFYSTRIFDTYSVANHIFDCNIDKDLKAGKKELVKKISEVPKKDKSKPRKFYSFASKYCSHHNSKSYPIYDYYVDNMLRHFRKKDKFCTFYNSELKEYKSFVEIFEKFQKHYKLSDFSLRNIDIYLWQAGKEYFPRKKQIKKNK